MKGTRALVFVFVAILAVGFVVCYEDDDVSRFISLISVHNNTQNVGQ